MDKSLFVSILNMNEKTYGTVYRYLIMAKLSSLLK